ncbi:ABC transporter ATP-binding protein [Methylophaga sp.]|jgi:peptide/nickel transport system ATP-binding protein|uniref:ABC transporter ATP-binding protein n=1 Tax=Methylophaga sp. TaxID=2024840 RepID=UPI0014015F11|nr:ABC transporter ATP-binding protein [Methylophaga sp.]MTI64014.1 ABC transporter ATP-binding protein [Methylophaga sp.]
MTETLLEVRGLKTWFGHDENPARAVDGIDFTIHRGETFALLGESGCGKSMTALSLLRLNPHPASRIVAGQVLLSGHNLLPLSETEMEKIRGRRVSMIFQEPQSSLNPVLSVGQQIGEVLNWHFNMDQQSIHDRSIELLKSVGIPDPQQRIKEYPHQLSGGMKQRVMIAMALAGEPELLIADEPTTALDVTIQAQILDLLKDIQQKTGMAIMLITHDLGVVAQMADHVAVMYAGQIVETASRQQFFNDTQHPYTRKLFEALPSEQKREEKLTVIKGSVPPLNQPFNCCRFSDRCDFAWQHCHDVAPRWLETEGHGVRCHLYDPDVSAERVKPELAVTSSRLSEVVPADKALLQADRLKVHFPIKKGILQRVVGHVKAVDGISLDLRPAETLALVGESGCGKTTVGKGILQLVPITSGQVSFRGRDMTRLPERELKEVRSAMQIIFQDPFSSMNPRMTITQVIEEGMLTSSIKDPAERARKVDELLERVGLRPDIKYRYPHEFSGGQRQRICIARALAAEPEVIICDEPTSALDVSVQAQILNLLRDIQHEFGLSYLFITHNIAVVDYLAHRVAVMYLGRVVEEGLRDEVLNSPKHPYTQALLSAVPKIDTETRQESVKLEGELPSPANPPKGCHFHQRCPHVMPICRETYPDLSQLSRSHTVKCYLYEDNYGSTDSN